MRQGHVIDLPRFAKNTNITSLTIKSYPPPPKNTYPKPKQKHWILQTFVDYQQVTKKNVDRMRVL